MRLHVLLLCLFCPPTISHAQQINTGRNTCVIRIQTEAAEYQFVTRDMNGRLNEALGRFEFHLPVKTIKSLGDASQLDLFRAFANGAETVDINITLPEDKDPELDLSYFRGNKSINLPGQVIIGKLLFEDDTDFNGLLMNNNQTLVFDFDLFSNTRQSSLQKIGDEQVIGIEIAARGDKILGLTNN